MENEAPDLNAPEAEDTGSKRADMSPDEAWARLREGKSVENVRIRGMKFQGTIPENITFKACLLVQPMFKSVTFQGTASFVACTIERAQFSRKATFEKNLTWDGSVFQKCAINGLVVKGEFFATHTQFKGKASFTGCEFGLKAHFWEAQFLSWCEFKDCTFHSEADFRSCHAEEGFVCTKSKFHGDFLFRGSNVEKKFSLDGCRMEKLVDLSKAKLHDFAYLEGIEGGPDTRFAMLNTVGERIRIQPEQIEGRLLSEKEGRHVDAMQEYGLLKKCYSTLHRFDQEDWAFYRFKVAQRLSRPASWKRPWTQWQKFIDWLFLDLGCGYGTNPVRAVRMAIVIILGFAAIYAWDVNKFYTDKLPFPGEGASKLDIENRIMIGLITSVSVFTSGMGGIREIAQGWMNVPVMLESIMGTLLFGLFIVAFSRKVIR
ncbi:MAG: pentapeptide repeat-containing protein [Fimbriiglobus sp.]